ncbi:MAG TPA: LysM domain-containing protein [Vicinamibacteria bacterium]|nr:LysM domain-containing protein [Vicinamibacteria bacterium]
MSFPPNPALAPFSLPTPSRFPATSRYARTPVAQWTLGDGTVISYLRRRFVPDPALFATLQVHVVVQGDRLDAVANQYLGDPEQFWRLCDANRVLRPEELTEAVGRRILITLPEGVPGPTDD